MKKKKIILKRAFKMKPSTDPKVMRLLRNISRFLLLNIQEVKKWDDDGIKQLTSEQLVFRVKFFEAFGRLNRVFNVVFGKKETHTIEELIEQFPELAVFNQRNPSVMWVY